MPVGIDLALVIVAFICAVFALAGKVPLGVSVLLICVEGLISLAGR